MEFKVIELMNMRLIKDLLDVEIKRVVKAIKSDSVSGVDGMLVYFF